MSEQNHSNIVMKLNLSQINTENRVRKDFGDIEALAKSIDELGLLSPIGVIQVSNGVYTLVFGERRMKAMQMLGRSHVAARVLDLDSIIEAEHDENEVRKDFTPSERVEIGKLLEKKIDENLGERRGRPSGEDFEIVPELEQFQGKKTLELAAEKVGMSKSTYHNAKSVVEHGAPELVEAMDSGKISISAAAQVAQLDIESQLAVARAEGKQELKAELDKAKSELQKIKEQAKILDEAKAELEKDRQHKNNLIDRLKESLEIEQKEQQKIKMQHAKEVDSKVKDKLNEMQTEINRKQFVIDDLKKSIDELEQQKMTLDEKVGVKVAYKNMINALKKIVEESYTPVYLFSEQSDYALSNIEEEDDIYIDETITALDSMLNTVMGIRDKIKATRRAKFSVVSG